MSPTAKKTPAVSQKEGRTVIENMTPEKALKLLERFEDARKKGIVNNRPVSDNRVDLLEKAIRNGEWLLTHQGIGIDERGYLLDGQHRLWAIVKAGEPVPIRVTYDLPSEVMSVIDRGRVRSLGNVLHIQGEKYGGTKAGIGRILAAFLLGNGSDDLRHYRQTDKIILDFVDRFHEDIEWFVSLKKKGAFASAPLAAVMVYAHSAFPEAMDVLAPKFLEGIGLSKGDPVHTLREKIIGDTSDVLLRRYPSKILLMKYAFNSFKHAVKGEPYFRVTDTIAGYEFFRNAKLQ